MCGFRELLVAEPRLKKYVLAKRSPVLGGDHQPTRTRSNYGGNLDTAGSDAGL
jgi:hypothetical protein